MHDTPSIRFVKAAAVAGTQVPAAMGVELSLSVGPGPKIGRISSFLTHF